MKMHYYYSKECDIESWGAKDEKRNYKWHDNPPVCNEEVWNYVIVDKNGYYTPQKHIVRVLDDYNDVLFSCLFYAAYARCCGMREIGEIVLIGGKEAVEFFYEKMKTSNAGNYGAFGCILYTEVKNDEERLLFLDGSTFCELWPGDKSASDWWYNPNSGNWCRNWTLTINQELAESGKDDEEPDDWD